MKVEMVDRPQIRVACLRHTGPPGEAVGRFWRQRVSPWLAEHGMLDCPRYGVTRGADCYDACVELPAGLSLSACTNGSATAAAASRCCRPRSRWSSWRNSDDGTHRPAGSAPRSP